MALNSVKLGNRRLLRFVGGVAAALATAITMMAVAAGEPLIAAASVQPPALALDTVALSSGRLIIQGKTAAPNTVVSIAGTQFSTRSGATGKFSFDLNYRTPDCLIKLSTGSASITAVISSCGLQGVMGKTGETGIAGPSGANGLAGWRGDKGVPGTKGKPGAIGPAGIPGPVGPVGGQGATGGWGLIPVSGSLQGAFYNRLQFVGPTYTHPRGNLPGFRVSLTAAITAGLGTTDGDDTFIYGLCLAYGGSRPDIEVIYSQKGQVTNTTTMFSVHGNLKAEVPRVRERDDASFIFGFCVDPGRSGLNKNSVLNGWILVEEEIEQ